MYAILQDSCYHVRLERIGACCVANCKHALWPAKFVGLSVRNMLITSIAGCVLNHAVIAKRHAIVSWQRCPKFNQSKQVPNWR